MGTPEGKGKVPLLRLPRCDEGQAEDSGEGAGEVKHVATLEIECENPGLIIKSLKPDMTEGKFTVKLEPLEKRLKMTVTAKDVGGLLAGVNSTTRLIKVTNDMESLE